MSRLPQPAKKCPTTDCPVVTSTSRKVTRIPGTNQTITTTTRTTRQNLGASGSQQPSTTSSGRLLVPGKTSTLPKRTPTSRQPPQLAPVAPRANKKSSLHPRNQVSLAGSYFMPAEFGPESRKGKGITYSSPPELRAQMAKRVPKELKYYQTSALPGTGKDRKMLAKRLPKAGIMAGMFDMYQGPCPTDTSFLTSEEDESDLLNKAFMEPDYEEAPGYQDGPERHVDALQELLNKSLRSPNDSVSAQAAAIIYTGAQMMMTPEGPQPIIQQAVLERRVERSAAGERVSKHLTATDMNERTGQVKQVELDTQQLDPSQGTAQGAPSEVVTITSKLSVSQTYNEVSKVIVREATGAIGQFDVNMDPATVSQLVAEEKEDVENTLKMVPPDLTLAPEKFALKKRLQNLRLNSESMALLEQSVIYPEPKADEAQNENQPEVLATIMHTVENGVTPQTAPAQIFNTLFSEAGNSQMITLTSIAAGPFQDVVVPTDVPQRIHNEVLTTDIQKLSDHMDDKITNAQELPSTNIFTQKVAQERKAPKVRRQIPFKPIGQEEPPWGHIPLESVVNTVGAEPINVVGVSDLSDLENELAKGVEYFVDADPLQYMSRVQLRGSMLPKWFPGYMVALPEYPEVVKIARSPSQVFLAAWKAVQPKIFPIDSIIID